MTSSSNLEGQYLEERQNPSAEAMAVKVRGSLEMCALSARVVLLNKALSPKKRTYSFC